MLNIEYISDSILSLKLADDLKDPTNLATPSEAPHDLLSRLANSQWNVLAPAAKDLLIKVGHLPPKSVEAIGSRYFRTLQAFKEVEQDSTAILPAKAPLPQSILLLMRLISALHPADENIRGKLEEFVSLIGINDKPYDLSVTIKPAHLTVVSNLISRLDLEKPQSSAYQALNYFLKNLKQMSEPLLFGKSNYEGLASIPDPFESQMMASAFIFTQSGLNANLLFEDILSLSDLMPENLVSLHIFTSNTDATNRAIENALPQSLDKIEQVFPHFGIMIVERSGHDTSKSNLQNQSGPSDKWISSHQNSFWIRSRHSAFTTTFKRQFRL